MEAAARTAVLIVHGMGEKRAMQILDDFTETALPPRNAEGAPTWDYHRARPPEITATYEARCYTTEPAETLPNPTDIYEYHWSFLMTAGRYAGVLPSVLRLFLRRPSNVPGPMFGIWRAVWAVLLAIVAAIPAMFVIGYVLDTDFPGWLIGLVSSAVILLFWLGLFRIVARALVNSVTTSLVDVARYLDPSPYSYAARRAVRGGLVDLLTALHDGRYSRVVVVSQGVGTYIAYDALAAFWSHTDRPPTAGAQLDALEKLETSADRLTTDHSHSALNDFQDRQFALWQEQLDQENPWRVSDFITVGAPMALADLLLTRPALFGGFSTSDQAHRRSLLERLIRRGAVVTCPPQPATLPVQGDGPRHADYRDNDQRLGPHCPFAVIRWTNMWFPVTRGELRGDWFGGALSPLFGPGIRDIAVVGNKPERLRRGSPHTEYFAHPDKCDEDDLAWHLRNALALRSGGQSNSGDSWRVRLSSKKCG